MGNSSCSSETKVQILVLSLTDLKVVVMICTGHVLLLVKWKSQKRTCYYRILWPSDSSYICLSFDYFHMTPSEGDTRPPEGNTAPVDDTSLQYLFQLLPAPYHSLFCSTLFTAVISNQRSVGRLPAVPFKEARKQIRERNECNYFGNWWGWYSQNSEMFITSSTRRVNTILVLHCLN